MTRRMDLLVAVHHGHHKLVAGAHETLYDGVGGGGFGRLGVHRSVTSSGVGRRPLPRRGRLWSVDFRVASFVGSGGQAAACASSSFDAGVVGLVDKRGDRVRGLVKQSGDRGCDDLPDGELELPGGVAEFG